MKDPFSKIKQHSIYQPYKWSICSIEIITLWAPFHKTMRKWARLLHNNFSSLVVTTAKSYNLLTVQGDQRVNYYLLIMRGGIYNGNCLCEMSRQFYRKSTNQSKQMKYSTRRTYPYCGENINHSTSGDKNHELVDIKTQEMFLSTGCIHLR